MKQKPTMKGYTSKTGRRISLTLALAALFLILLLIPTGLPQKAAAFFEPDEFWVRVNQKWTGDAEGSWAKPFRKFSDGWAVVDQWAGDNGFPAILVINDGHYAAGGIYDKPARLEIYDDGSVREGPVILEPFPELRGIADTEACPWGSADCNRCVADVLDSFNNIRDHGEILGFNMGGHPPPQWGAGSLYSKHWQGVQRLAAAPTAQDAGRYMVITRDDIVIDGSGYSGFQIVYMGSRNGSGERYRSNRLEPRVPYNHSVPPGADVVVKTQKIDDEEEHPGGIQVLGNFLIVGAGEEVHLYDLGDPRNPVHLGPVEAGSIDGIGPIFKRPDLSGSSTSLAKLGNGRYLLVISSSDARPLDFYISDKANALLDDPAQIKFSNFDRVTESEIGSIFGSKADGGYQSLNLLTECGSGQLYLLGTHNNGGCIGSVCWPWKEDWADLYTVDESENEVILEKVANRHFYCTAGFDPYNGYCNFDAAAGLYVDPDGQMILYATEHDNQGPDDTVDFMEFRQVPRKTTDPQGRCDTMDEAWVELYRNDLNDSAGWGESIMIDYLDRDLEDYSSYNYFDPYGDPGGSANGWWNDNGGRISAASYCLPAGQNEYYLYENINLAGWGVVLNGTGQVQEIPNLHNYNGHDRGDAVSSSCWSDESGCAP